MSERTGIAWTDHTFNPWWGCMKVSPGCDHCYAERDAARFSPDMQLWGPDSERRVFGDKHWNGPLAWNRRAIADGVRRRVFCASMADVFDKEAPYGARERLWQLIAATPALDWLILTKRIGNASKMLPSDFGGNGFSNVWLGASVVNQEEANRDIPHLLGTPSRIHFISYEPALGPIDLTRIIYPKFKQRDENDPYVAYDVLRGHMLGPDDIGLPKLDWVIVGGESGPKARPFSIEWARDVVEQCCLADVACFVKQLGAKPEVNGNRVSLRDRAGADPFEWPIDLHVQEWPRSPIPARTD